LDIINVKQGTKEWLNLRMGHFTASEAPAMMGVSKYQKRDELLTMKKTGVSQQLALAKLTGFRCWHHSTV